MLHLAILQSRSDNATVRKRNIESRLGPHTPSAQSSARFKDLHEEVEYLNKILSPDIFVMFTRPQEALEQMIGEGMGQRVLIH